MDTIPQKTDLDSFPEMKPLSKKDTQDLLTQKNATYNAVQEQIQPPSQDTSAEWKYFNEGVTLLLAIFAGVLGRKSYRLNKKLAESNFEKSAEKAEEFFTEDQNRFFEKMIRQLIGQKVLPPHIQKEIKKMINHVAEHQIKEAEERLEMVVNFVRRTENRIAPDIQKTVYLMAATLAEKNQNVDREYELRQFIRDLDPSNLYILKRDLDDFVLLDPEDHQKDPEALILRPLDEKESSVALDMCDSILKQEQQIQDTFKKWEDSGMNAFHSEKSSEIWKSNYGHSHEYFALRKYFARVHFIKYQLLKKAWRVQQDIDDLGFSNFERLAGLEAVEKRAEKAEKLDAELNQTEADKDAFLIIQKAFFLDPKNALYEFFYKTFDNEFSPEEALRAIKKLFKTPSAKDSVTSMSLDKNFILKFMKFIELSDFSDVGNQELFSEVEDIWLNFIYKEVQNRPFIIFFRSYLFWLLGEAHSKIAKKKQRIPEKKDEYEFHRERFIFYEAERLKMIKNHIENHLGSGDEHDFDKKIDEIFYSLGVARKEKGDSFIGYAKDMYELFPKRFSDYLFENYSQKEAKKILDEIQRDDSLE